MANLNWQNYWFFRLVSILSILCLSLIFILFILARIMPVKQVKNSEIFGLVVDNQIWGGEVRITGDLWVVPGAKITIEPGTKITIATSDDKSNFDYLPSHLKSGINTGEKVFGIENGEPFWNEKEKVQIHFAAVEAKGIKEMPIIITSDRVSGSAHDVNLISVSKGLFNFVNFSNFRRLEIGEKVAILNSSFSRNSDCAVCIKYGSPLIADNTFFDSKKSYIQIGLASPEIRHNRFLRSEGDGIVIWGDNFENVKVYDNYFYIPAKKAVRVIPLDEGGIIAGNIFDAGDIELPCNSKVRVMNNFIKGQIIFKNMNNCFGEYNLGGNYWDMDNADEILRARIVGVTANFKVTIGPVSKIVPDYLQSNYFGK